MYFSAEFAAVRKHCLSPFLPPLPARFPFFDFLFFCGFALSPKLTRYWGRGGVDKGRNAERGGKEWGGTIIPPTITIPRACTAKALYGANQYPPKGGTFWEAGDSPGTGTGGGGHGVTGAWVRGLGWETHHARQSSVWCEFTSLEL